MGIITTLRNHKYIRELIDLGFKKQTTNSGYKSWVLLLPSNIEDGKIQEGVGFHCSTKLTNWKMAVFADNKIFDISDIGDTPEASIRYIKRFMENREIA